MIQRERSSGTKATPEKIQLLHEEWGLDKPLPVQYERYMERLVRGDLGTSLFYDVPAGRLVLDRLPVTLWLIGLGALFSVLLAVPLATIAAARREGVSDHVIRAVPLVGLGFPSFWIGIMLLTRVRAQQRTAVPRKRLWIRARSGTSTRCSYRR